MQFDSASVWSMYYRSWRAWPCRRSATRTPRRWRTGHCVWCTDQRSFGAPPSCKPAMTCTVCVIVLWDQLGVILFEEGNPWGNTGNILDIQNPVLRIWCIWKHVWWGIRAPLWHHNRWNIILDRNEACLSHVKGIFPQCGVLKCLTFPNGLLGVLMTMAFVRGVNLLASSSGERTQSPLDRMALPLSF